ncbi:MAG TPA: NUDIX domain-containing protein [Thermomicrobiales bacterium]|nr:NUDIX domain-containing protein [Thermomicrobiales bacterium]
MLQPDEPARDLERRFFEETGARRRIRVAARALVLLDDHILLQQLDYSDAFWFFPGGEVEFGETLEQSVRRELAEETSLDVRRIVYRFTANNRFARDGGEFHLLEHFFEVTPSSFDVASLEESVRVEWHPVDSLSQLDVRPWGVRDILALSGWQSIRLLEVE